MRATPMPLVARQVLDGLTRGEQPMHAIPPLALRLMRGRGWVTGRVSSGLAITEAGREALVAVKGAK